MSVSGFVKAHWTEDWYFGYQCLNGCNPLLLRQIHLLPPNLSVTSDILQPFLPEGSSLDQELQVCMLSFDFQLCNYSSCCILMFYHVTERNHLPAGLRGFGRRPSQRDQWEAVIFVFSAVSSPSEPAGTASPHRHPGELQVV